MCFESCCNESISYLYEHTHTHIVRWVCHFHLSGTCLGTCMRHRTCSDACFIRASGHFDKTYVGTRELCSCDTTHVGGSLRRAGLPLCGAKGLSSCGTEAGCLLVKQEQCCFFCCAAGVLRLRTGGTCYLATQDECLLAEQKKSFLKA